MPDSQRSSEARQLRQAAHEALTWVWSGLRTRRTIRPGEYVALSMHMRAYVAARFGVIDESGITEIVDEALTLFLARSAGDWPGLPRVSPEDCFAALDDVAFARIRGPTDEPVAPVASLASNPPTDAQLIGAIFGGGLTEDDYRRALTATQADGHVNEYLVITQTLDLHHAIGRMPTAGEVNDRLRGRGITEDMVTAMQHHFADRLREERDRVS
jgi:hypothetical protein